MRCPRQETQVEGIIIPTNRLLLVQTVLDDAPTMMSTSFLTAAHTRLPVIGWAVLAFSHDHILH